MASLYGFSISTSSCWEIEGHLAQLFTHPKLHNLGASKEPRLSLAGLGHVEPPTGVTALYLGVGALGHFSQVILGPCGDLPREQLLSHPARQHSARAVEELLTSVQVLLSGQVLGEAKPPAPGNDGHLQRVGRCLCQAPRRALPAGLSSGGGDPWTGH